MPDWNSNLVLAKRFLSWTSRPSGMTEIDGLLRPAEELQCDSYVGWIALSTKREWCDNDWDSYGSFVRELIGTLSPEGGHDPSYSDAEVLPHVVYLKGSEVDSLSGVLKILVIIGKVFNASFGELVATRGFDLDNALRYEMRDGQLRERS